MALPETQPAPTTNLILPSLEIKSFRAFRHLVIPKLGRVNLITGKNNVGKTSLLEALWVYAEGGAPQVLRRLLLERGELKRKEAGRYETTRSVLLSDIDETDVTSNLGTIFHGRKQLGEGPHMLSIGLADTQDRLLELTTYPDELHDNFVGTVHINLSSHIEPVRTYPMISVVDSSTASDKRYYQPRLKYQYIFYNGLEQSQISKLWDRIALTNLEDDIVEALRIIEPKVERINLVGQQNGSDLRNGRIAFTRLSGIDTPVTLGSLGGGLNRIFGVILALVNSGDGILLIDEVENGFHYSVLPDVWRLLFHTARRLNVQVFATTHSWDCIEAFQQAAEEDEQDEGVLIRLKEADGEVKAIVFGEEELKIITRQQIEVR